MNFSTLARHPFVELQKHDYCTIYVLPRSECLFSPSLVPYGHCFHWYGSSFDDLRCTLHNHELGAKPHAHNQFRHSLRILPRIRLLFCDFSSIIYFCKSNRIFRAHYPSSNTILASLPLFIFTIPSTIYDSWGAPPLLYQRKNAAKLLRHHSRLPLSTSRLSPSKLQPTSLQHSARGPPLLQTLAQRQPSSHINSAPTHDSNAQ
jgi:hypothetical protein